VRCDNFVRPADKIGLAPRAYVEIMHELDSSHCEFFVKIGDGAFFDESGEYGIPVSN
jgi:hypothetical protein